MDPVRHIHTIGMVSYSYCELGIRIMKIHSNLYIYVHDAIHTHALSYFHTQYPPQAMQVIILLQNNSTIHHINLILWQVPKCIMAVITGNIMLTGQCQSKLDQ